MKTSLTLLTLGLCLSAAGQVAARRESVIVTGSYDPVPLEEADRSVRLLPVREDLLLANTWADLLHLDPALDLRARAPNGVQSDLSIRGGTFGQTLVLLNGLRMNDAQTGHHNLDIPVPLESLSRIEVLRGSGSTLYGSDAVGGVVNFIASAPEASEFRLRTAAGSFGTNQQRVSLAGVRGNLSQQLAVSRDFSSGFRPGRDYRNLSIFSTTHVSTALGTTGILLGHNDRPFGANGFYGNFNSWERTRTWFSSLRQQFGPDTEAAFAFRRHTDLFVLHRDRPDVFTNRHAVESFQAAIRRRTDAGRNARLYYGLEGCRDSIDSSNLGRHVRGRAAGYAAFDARALRRFSFSLGAREEMYRKGAGQFSPSASGGVWLNQHLKLRTAVGRAFRLPSFTDLYYHDPANIGSPDLRPEVAWNYEAGLDWNAAGLSGSVTLFQRRERDGIDYVRRSAADIWRAMNIQRLRLTGVEASVRARVARSQALEFSYAALDGAQEALSGLFSRYVFNYPSHAGVASWQGVLPGGIIGRTRLGVTRRVARDPYPIWDAALALDRFRLRPFVQATNLTGSAYEEIAGVPMPGRAFVFGLELVMQAARK